MTSHCPCMLRGLLLAGVALALGGLPALPGTGEASAEAADASADERPSDAAVRTRIVERLAASRSLEGSDIWVSVEERCATLHGVVQNEATARRAVEIARRTRGVRSVASELESEPGLAERRRIEIRDENLAEHVARTLVKEVFPNARPEPDWLFAWEVEGMTWELQVEADMGDVTLSGVVPSHDDIGRAVRSARKVPGVRSVRSRLGFMDPMPWTVAATGGHRVRETKGRPNAGSNGSERGSGIGW